jgi:hypothetical protein
VKRWNENTAHSVNCTVLILSRKTILTYIHPAFPFRILFVVGISEG